MGEHAFHQMHANSLEAYEEELPKLGKRAAMIHRFLVTIGRPMTDRQVKDALGFSDMNAVRPRITELVGMGIVSEVGDALDPITGKTVRLVAPSSAVASQQPEVDGA